MNKRLFFWLTVLVVVNYKVSSQQSDYVQTKRILLNDPDVIIARLVSLEQTVQKLSQTQTHLQAELAQEKENGKQLQAALTNLSKIESRVQNLGSTYVRWGRKQCPVPNTDLIYTGYTTGQPHSFSSHYYGGPTNILCLPNNPNLSNRTAPGNSLLFGSEFEDGDFFAKGAEDEDVPCTLCRSRDTVSSVMIPGRDTCYNGWKMEYRGILASGHMNHRPSSYICVDRNPEFLQAGERNDNGFIIYATGVQCGSLPCPPYANKMEINCVVCSK